MPNWCYNSVVLHGDPHSDDLCVNAGKAIAKYFTLKIMGDA